MKQQSLTNTITIRTQKNTKASPKPDVKAQASRYDDDDLLDGVNEDLLVRMGVQLGMLSVNVDAWCDGKGGFELPQERRDLFQSFIRKH